MSDNLSEEIEDIWQMEVEPYLEEYFFDNQSKEIIESFRWFNVQKQIY
jgi:5-methylcytosine-specific restriction enzyme B